MKVLPLNKQLKYKLFPRGSSERDYWKNLDVNIDAICDHWESNQLVLERILSEFSSQDLTKIAKTYRLNWDRQSPFSSLLLQDQKAAIETFCCIQFAKSKRKTLSNHFQIPIRKGEINFSRLYTETLVTHKSATLNQLYLLSYVLKKGSVKIPFNIGISQNQITFSKIQPYIQKLVRYLNTTDAEKKEHHLRFAAEINKDLYFLVLKETGDRLYTALPVNTRVQVAKAILIRFVAKTGQLMIDSKNPKETFAIKNFIARKSKLSIRYVKKTAKYNPQKFFDAITSETNINDQIKLVDVKFKKLNIGDYLVEIKEANKKNDIIHVINWLKNSGVLVLKDFSEINALEFISSNIQFNIVIQENSWGQLKLKIVDRNKQPKDLDKFKRAFEKAYNIPFDATLIHENETLDKIAVTRRIVDNKTIRAEMPQEIEDIVLDLMKSNFIKKPTKNAKRRCFDCKQIYWSKGHCPNCGGDSFFEGDFLDIILNESAFIKYFQKSLSASKQFKASPVVRSINGKKISFIEVIDKEGNFLSIFLSKSNPPQAILDHFSGNGNPLLIVLLKYTNANINLVHSHHFEATDFAEIAYLDQPKIEKLVLGSIVSQKQKWRSKVIEKGANSFKRILSKPATYDDQDFEQDIYNILHEIFLIGDRMGGKFAGINAPDGIVSVKSFLSATQRYCFAWDCKYSVNAKGYQLNDSPQKHKRYLNTLSKLEKIKFFGGLKTYAIISQHMNMTTYQKFYNKLLFRSRWKGNLLFIHEDNLKLLYQIYKTNSEFIHNYPSVFFQRVYKLFLYPAKRESDPYRYISNKRILNLYEQVKAEFKKKHKQFKFNRSDF